jgi:hypothetical protein
MTYDSVRHCVRSDVERAHTRVVFLRRVGSGGNEQRHLIRQGKERMSE